jgi:hypothetical protein
LTETLRNVAGSIPDAVIVPGFYSTCNRNEYQWYLVRVKGGRCVRLKTLPHSYADCLEILGASNSWNPKGLSSPVKGFFFNIERVG